MSQATTRRVWTWDEYLAWEARQPTKHEFVDGQPRALVGSTARHDMICNNLRRELSLGLRGSSCRLQGPDLKLRSVNNARYPDALIDCGPRIGSSLFAQEPAAVFEVLSRSTAWIDQTLKLRDYETVRSIRSYALVGRDEPRVVVYVRDAEGRLSATGAVLLEGLGQSLDIPHPALSIPLGLIYEDVVFDPE